MRFSLPSLSRQIKFIQTQRSLGFFFLFGNKLPAFTTKICKTAAISLPSFFWTLQLLSFFPIPPPTKSHLLFSFLFTSCSALSVLLLFCSCTALPTQLHTVRTNSLCLHKNSHCPHFPSTSSHRHIYFTLPPYLPHIYLRPHK